jgi:hypothetical protein
MRVNLIPARYFDLSGAARTLSSPSAILCCALVAGAAFRISQYTFRTSIWHDEAFIALNIIHKSYAGLLGSLEWNESSPPGFTILEKMTFTLFGSSEYAWRLIPLAAGLAGLLSFSGLSCEVLGSSYARSWAVVMMAASDKLVSQSNELKHFSLDLLLAVLIWWLAIRAFYSSSPTRLVLILGFTGALGIWLSFASGFVFAGAGLALCWPALFRWDWTARLALVSAGAIGMLSFLILLPTLHAQSGAGLIEFWKNSFPDPTDPVRMAIWLGRSVLGLFNYFWQPLGLVVLLVAGLGIAQVCQFGSRAAFVMLWIPVGLSLLAAFVHRWPFGGNQHMVFAAPAVLLTVAVGIESVRTRLISKPVWSGLIVAAFLIPPSAAAAYHLIVPRYRHEARSAIEFYQANRLPDDGVSVQCVAEFEFYAPGVRGRAAESPVPTKRLWIITTGSGAKGFDHTEIAKLAPNRPYLDGLQVYGAGAYLFGPEIHSSR